MNNIENIFYSLLKNNNSKYKKEFKFYFKKTNARLNNKYIPYLPYPFFISEDRVANLQKKIKPLFSILKKINKFYFKNNSIKKYYDLKSPLKEMVEANFIGKFISPMMRLDTIYYNENNFKICEINTDGSSGMNEVNSLDNVFLKTTIGKKLKSSYNIDYFDLFNPWSEKCIEEYKKNFKKNPASIAIVDWKDVATIEEFKEFKKIFNKYKIKCYIIDPREFNYSHKGLIYKNKKIDFIYRRLVSQEVLFEPENLQNFIKAYLSKKILCLGPFRNELFHSKLSLSLMHKKNFQKLLTNKEKKFIKNHIPWTKKIIEIKNFDNFIKNKNKYLIKPHNLYGSRDIHCGKNYTIQQWQKLLFSLKNNQNYIIQDFFEPAKISLNFNKYYFLPSFFIYFHKLAGFYIRVSKNKIISTNLGAKVIPVIKTK